MPANGWPTGPCAHEAPVRLSLVIPAFNEAALLPRLLDSVDRARAAYTFGSDAIEVIVVDNGSTDETSRIAIARACRVVGVATRTIASARNGGAEVAVGGFLAFIDADMRIHPDSFNAVDDALSDPTIVGGASGIRPERWSLGIGVAMSLLTLFSFVTQIDAGLTFCRRDDFQRLAGYDERRWCAEDVDFLRRLKHLGRSGQRRLARGGYAPAVYSTRKFDKYGDWHYLGLGARLMLSRSWRAEARSEAVSEYWYRDRA